MGLNKEKKFKRNQISCGVTWIDSKIIFTEIMDRKRMWIGTCHYTLHVFAFAPFDFSKMTKAITTITVEPEMNYCEKARECVHYKCPLNRFDKTMFLKQYDESSGFSLALPKDFGPDNVLWFNKDEYELFWGKIIHHFGTMPEGGVLEYSEERAKSKLIL